MSLQKGFLRDSDFKPSVYEWVMATVIFLVSAFLLHLLMVLIAKSILLTLTEFFTAPYLYDNEENALYSWILASVSSIAGLNFALRFLLRQNLNIRDPKRRMAYRLAYHYVGLNNWGHLAWITRLAYHLAFMTLILSLQSLSHPGIDYKWALVLLVADMFLGTWLMVHRVLKRRYFQYLTGSTLALFYAFLLLKVYPIDFTLYNNQVAKRSILTVGTISPPQTIIYTDDRDLRPKSVYLFSATEGDSTIVRAKFSSKFQTVSPEEILSMDTAKVKDEVSLIIDKNVPLQKILEVQTALLHWKSGLEIQYRRTPYLMTSLSMEIASWMFL